MITLFPLYGPIRPCCSLFRAVLFALQGRLEIVQPTGHFVHCDISILFFPIKRAKGQKDKWEGLLLAKISLETPANLLDTVFRRSSSCAVRSARASSDDCASSSCQQSCSGIDMQRDRNRLWPRRAQIRARVQTQSLPLAVSCRRTHHNLTGVVVVGRHGFGVAKGICAIPRRRERGSGGAGWQTAQAPSASITTECCCRRCGRC